MYEDMIQEESKKSNGKIITSIVKVIGVKRLNFNDKNGKAVEGVKIFYCHPIEQNDYTSSEDFRGHFIDPNNYSCFVKDINRYNEFTYKNLPYEATLEQEFIATNKPLKFIDIK